MRVAAAHVGVVKVSGTYIDIDECVRVGSNNGCIDRRVGRRDIAKEEISMPME